MFTICQPFKANQFTRNIPLLVQSQLKLYVTSLIVRMANRVKIFRAASPANVEITVNASVYDFNL